MKLLSIIQLNTRHFKHYDAISHYLTQELTDIICLQEVATGILTSSRWINNPWVALTDLLWYHYAFGPRYGTISADWYLSQMWYAIISKYPIISQKMYYVSWDYCIISESDALVATGMTDDANLKSESFHIDQTLPSWVLECMIDIEWISVRCMTTKFPASPDHKESEHMVQHAQLINDIVGTSESKIATILWLDCNITPTAQVIQYLYKDRDTSHDLHNTLNPTLHPWFQNWIPAEGLKVDYIFTQWCDIIEYTVDQVNLSDHYPVRCSLAIK